MPHKIVVIDDNADNLTSIRALLKAFLPDAAVFTALSGSEGLNVVRQERPDVILLDIVMPGMDGYAVCTRLKTEERTRHIPVIMLTAFDIDFESRIQALELGADAFLAKPIEDAELGAQINVMLRIKMAEDRLRREKERLEQQVQEKMRALRQELDERKRAEEELRKSKERLRGFMDSATDGLTLLDSEFAGYISSFVVDGTKTCPSNKHRHLS